MELKSVSKATGPLKACPENPRYFCDEKEIPVYLTGSHTWSNMQDQLSPDPNEKFDFEEYLDWMKAHNFNFMRGWMWEQAAWDAQTKEKLLVNPTIYLRTGPGEALDGKPKFDITKFNPEYFERIRARIIACRDSGIYVSIMLFQGFATFAKRGDDGGNPWKGHPFNPANNINGINGDPEKTDGGRLTHTLKIPDITRIQEKYVEKVIDTVNDLDNILFEIVNESGGYSVEWQYHIIRYIHEYEKKKGRKHPVGMTVLWEAGAPPCRNEDLFKSPAEWISPNPEGGYVDNPPAADGSKVIITDTDHLWGHGGTVPWVWKSICRGMNPILMDPYKPFYQMHELPFIGSLNSRDHPLWEPIRLNLGYARGYALRMDLKKCVPMNDMASSGYCLASPGKEYLVYLPDGIRVQVNLGKTSGEYSVEWFDPNSGKSLQEKPVPGGEERVFICPFASNSVLYLKNSG